MKFFVNLFNPKMIGQYFTERLIKPIIYLLFFVAICSIPSVMREFENVDVTYTDDTSLIMEIKGREPSSMEISSNRLNDTTKVVTYYGETFGVAFNTTKVDDSYALVLSFADEYVQVMSYGEIIKSVRYEKLDDSSLSISKIQASDYGEIHKLINYLDIAYDAYKEQTRLPAIGMQIGTAAISLLLVVLLLVLSSRLFNSFIPARIRFVIAIYASTWAFALRCVDEFTGKTSLFYIGAIVSFVFNAIAVKQIVKVKKA